MPTPPPAPATSRAAPARGSGLGGPARRARQEEAQRQALSALAGICATLFIVCAITNNRLGLITFGVNAIIFGGATTAWGRLHRLGGALVTLGAGLVVACSTGLAAVNSGGLGAPALFALPTVPMVMSWLRGPRAGLAWGLICALPPIGFFVLADHVPPARLAPDALRVMQLAGPLGCTAVVLSLAVFYERSVARSEAALDAAREAAEQASAAKTAWMSGLSHELRTPLGAVVGLTELLQQEELPMAQRRQVDLLRAASLQLLGLVDDVLDVKRIEAGEMPLSAAPFTAGSLASEVVETMRHRAEARGCTLLLEIEGEGGVVGDAQRLRQVLLNLVSNAIKFTTDGTISVRVWTLTLPGGTARQLQIDVADTGVGISPEQQEALFRPWAQASAPLPRSGAGGSSGLGLHLSRQLVERMGGELALQSSAGQGSTFTVRVELPAAPAQRAAAPARRADPLRLRVLLVEDDAVSREVVAAMLGGLGCRVDVAGSGPEALEAVAAHVPDVVIMDNQLPGFGGVEATRRLRALGCTARIIALSGAAQPEDRAACLDAGMDGFVAKPARLSQLRAALEPAPAG